MKKIVFLAAAVLLSCGARVSAVTAADASLIADVLCAECAGEPFAARVTIAGELLDMAAEEDGCVADAVRALGAAGVFSLGGVASVDRGSAEYRVSADAVDAAIAGCRPLGEVSRISRAEKERPSLDFADGEEQPGVRLGNFVFE